MFGEYNFSLKILDNFLAKFPNCKNLEIKENRNLYFHKILDQFLINSDEEIKDFSSISHIQSLASNQICSFESDIDISLANQTVYYVYNFVIKCLKFLCILYHFYSFFTFHKNIDMKFDYIVSHHTSTCYFY